MLYHASNVAGLDYLKPNISNHNQPLVYFSRKRENVLVYLSNAVEKYCREEKFDYDGKFCKWGPYGFDKDGKLEITEYYPNALESTYKGVSAFIYGVGDFEESSYETEIAQVVTSATPVEVTSCEFIVDAYDEIIKAENEGLITIKRYEELTEKNKQSIARMIKEQYDGSEDKAYYRFFLERHFSDIL